MSPRILNAIRLATHPALLVLGTIASVILWMPFGEGYYGWPWQSAPMRVLLDCFVYSFPIFALLGLLSAFTRARSVTRAVIATIALLIAIFGIFAMSNWKDRYVQPMLQRTSRL